LFGLKKQKRGEWGEFSMAIEENLLRKGRGQRHCSEGRKTEGRGEGGSCRGKRGKRGRG